MTGTQLITGALRILGEIRAPGQTASPEDLSEGLIALNAMIDSWNLERFNIYTIATGAYPLTSGTQMYGIGPTGANFTAPRPLKIANAGILSYNVAGDLVRSRLEMLDQFKWQEIANKQARSSVPERLYYDRGAPTGNIYLWPIPVFSMGAPPQVELSTWYPLPAFPDVTTQEYFPQGYELPLTYNLAIHMAPRFAVEPTQATIQIAKEGKTAMRAMNASLAGQDPPTGALNAIPEEASK